MAYTPASVSRFKMHYPEFADVPADVVQYWLDDAALTVGDCYTDPLGPKAQMALAAHNMTLRGLGQGSGGGTSGLANSGVTSFRSASMSVQFSSEVIDQRTSGGYNSTPYGREYLLYRRQSGCYAMPFLAGKCC